jgi:hypothetical protein
MAVVTSSLTSLAGVLGELGDGVEAVQLHRESLAMSQRLHGGGVDHQSVAPTSQGDLAAELLTQGDHYDPTEATRAVLRVTLLAAMQRRVYGAGTPLADVATAVRSVAARQGDVTSVSVRDCIATRCRCFAACTVRRRCTTTSWRR